MGEVVQINVLRKYLHGKNSEQAVQTLMQFIQFGIQALPSNKVNNRQILDDVLSLKWAIASDPNASPKLLARLAQSCESALLVKIAENGQTDAHTLASLATHSDPTVRMAVSENPKTPFATLLALAWDECLDVRFHLAENHNISRQILEVLIADENPYVSCRAQATFNRLVSMSPHPAYCAA